MAPPICDEIVAFAGFWGYNTRRKSFSESEQLLPGSLDNSASEGRSSTQSVTQP
jgi:hypothetical protein